MLWHDPSYEYLMGAEPEPGPGVILLVPIVPQMVRVDLRTIVQDMVRMEDIVYFDPYA